MIGHRNKLFIWGDSCVMDPYSISCTYLVAHCGRKWVLEKMSLWLSNVAVPALKFCTVTFLSFFPLPKFMLLFSLLHTFNISWFYRELRRGRIFPHFTPLYAFLSHLWASLSTVFCLLDNLLMWDRPTSGIVRLNIKIAFLYFAGNCLKYKTVSCCHLSSVQQCWVTGKKTRKGSIAPTSTSYRLWEGMWKL